MIGDAFKVFPPYFGSRPEQAGSLFPVLDFCSGPGGVRFVWIGTSDWCCTRVTHFSDGSFVVERYENDDCRWWPWPEYWLGIVPRGH